MTVVSNRTTKAPRRHAHRRSASRARSGWKARLVSIVVLLVVGLFIWAIASRQFAPTGNTSQRQFDAIIVLGSTADRDGNPTPTQLARVTESVREYERGVAPRLIVTGGGLENGHMEAEVMARTAEAQGVPPSAVAIESKALDTIQNACYSVQIMKAHGWKSAEVVSSPSHLPRLELVFSQMPIAWHSHAAPPLAPESTVTETALSTVEILKTMRYLTWARWREQCEP